MAVLRAASAHPAEPKCGAGERQLPAVSGAADLAAVRDGTGGKQGAAVGILDSGRRTELAEGFYLGRCVLLGAHFVAGYDARRAVPEPPRSQRARRAASETV